MIPKGIIESAVVIAGGLFLAAVIGTFAESEFRERLAHEAQEYLRKHDKFTEFLERRK